MLKQDIHMASKIINTQRLLIICKGAFTIEACGRHKGTYQEFKVSMINNETNWHMPHDLMQ